MRTRVPGSEAKEGVVLCMQETLNLDEHEARHACFYHLEPMLALALRCALAFQVPYCVLTRVQVEPAVCFTSDVRTCAQVAMMWA